MQIEIKTQDDLEQHFKWHDSECEKIDNAIHKLLENIPLTKEQGEALDYLHDKKDSLRVDCYPLELEDNGKITMYVNQEGSCMSNIQYCPFCGIRFEITKSTESD